MPGLGCDLDHFKIELNQLGIKIDLREYATQT